MNFAVAGNVEAVEDRPDETNLTMDGILLDTSVSVALCSADHVAHHQVIAAIGDRAVGLAGHAWFETFSVLTRLPAPQRRPASDVLDLLKHNFPSSVFVDAADQIRFTEELRDLPISGGAIYDGLVGLAARSSGRPLLSRDRRASATYASLEIVVEFLD